MTLIKHSILTLSVAAALAACGGGADSPEPTTREGFASALRTQALAVRPLAAVSTVAPDEAARQLMDFAEATFPGLLPGHPATQTYAGFIKYRAYSTGIVLGVVVANTDPAYPLLSVLVLGGPFGATPIKVGTVTDFITPVDPNPDPGPVGSGNGCYDLALADTQGATSKVVYDYTGVSTGTQTIESVTGAMTTFEGQQARLLTAKTTGSNTTAGQTITLNTEIKSYQRRTADAEVTNYGTEVSATGDFGGFPATISTKTVWNPPWVDRRYALAIGGSLTQTYSGTTTQTTVGLPFPVPPTSGVANVSTTVKYLRQESVTVPAGTYNACVYEDTSGSGANATTTTSWIIVGKGIMAQAVSGSGSTQQTIKATSITVNGQKL